jgi:hypothetical protein
MKIEIPNSQCCHNLRVLGPKKCCKWYMVKRPNGDFCLFTKSLIVLFFGLFVLAVMQEIMSAFT